MGLKERDWKLGNWGSLCEGKERKDEMGKWNLRLSTDREERERRAKESFAENGTSHSHTLLSMRMRKEMEFRFCDLEFRRVSYTPTRGWPNKLLFLFLFLFFDHIKIIPFLYFFFNIIPNLILQDLIDGIKYIISKILNLIYASTIRIIHKF